MTSPGGSVPGSGAPGGFAGPSGAPAAPPSGGNGLAGEVHTLERAIFEVKRIIVGQDQLVERILVGLLAKGHVLLEGVPGVAKTLAVETFAKVVGGTFARIQFTPDLVPTDIIGTRIYRQGREEFDIELGPVVVNFLLADEINRAPAKVQSALLEVMAERKISIGGKTFPLPKPFLVMATQNPIEINVDYPSPEEEREIIYRMGVKPPEPKQILNTGDLLRLQEVAANNFVHHALVDYVVRVVTATRRPEQFGLNDVKSWIAFGASPRASLGIIAASRALALVRGRDYVIPQDVVEVIPDVLRHRLVLTYDALADDVKSETVISRILQTVALPQVNAVPQQGHSVPPVVPAAAGTNGR
jgi:MoxR-like ATPase